ncbi:pitrilysin family protein [Alteromonas sp. C1M14]|uniref:M16 family metallopeptidase n=1 Tax=Alteromonas sp. C1M14 TaxID=2841567 RepID=UPI001C088165|nr:pitrilysin family protein [Alteromonas sp. C1M14]MBU2980096.1 insulinase family protein [Alteromonas sp. C1M14]
MGIHRLSLGLLACALVLVSGCDNNQTTAQNENVASTTAISRIQYEKFQLENGLNVVFHVDRSDPVVGVTLAAHVGSAREKPGRTGFAHLFEHLLFLESENLGKGGLDEMSARIGGSGANGSTSRDVTNYLQTVPNDALEKMIWAEADKLGYFINTVTDPVLAKEKEVVKNEKRQRVDNRPYGHKFGVITQNLYPQGHPYSWQTIGSLEDIQAASLADVKGFYKKWYVPNNVTLVVAGDFDTEQAKQWVEKYFGEIPRGGPIEPLAKQPAELAQTKDLYYEDNFATLPQLTLVWPTAEKFAADSYAMEILSRLLADGKQAPLYSELVNKQKLTADVSVFDYRTELAGELIVTVNAFDGVDLDKVKAGLDTAFQRFEKDKFSEGDLQRIKAGLETEYYSRLASVLGKSARLADYNLIAGDPDLINKEIDYYRQVTADDVWRVYHRYIKNKPYVSTSFVPKGQLALSLEGATAAVVKEENITPANAQNFASQGNGNYPKTPSTFDRTIEPPYGEPPSIPVPKVSQSTLSNGINVATFFTDEVPLVEFQLSMDGGALFDETDKVGTANLMAELLNRGTKNKTPAQLEQAIKQLGAEINIFASKEALTIRVSALSRNFDATVALAREMLLSPRWAPEEFELAKSDVLSQIKRRQSNPDAIAKMKMSQLLYSPDNPLSHSLLGDEQSVQSLTLDDVKQYYQRYVAPQFASVQIAGDVPHKQAMKVLSSFTDNWPRTDVVLPTLPAAKMPAQGAIYFYDVPGAKQSTIRVAHPSLLADEPDYYPATVMNYILGGGGFASRLTQVLREEKGYTYGATSRFSASQYSSEFIIDTSVRTNVTYESLALIKEIVTQYANTFSKADLATTKSFYLKSNARRFETLGAKLSVLENIAVLGLPNDFVQQRAKAIAEMSVEEVKVLAKKYIKPQSLIYVVVGDAETQLPRLQGLGLGEVTRLN